MNEVKITNEPPQEKPISKVIPKPKEPVKNYNLIQNNYIPRIEMQIIEPIPVYTPSTCEKHNQSRLEYYFECDNVLGCNYCIQNHTQCPNFKKILLKDLPKCNEDLKDLISNIDCELNQCRDLEKNHISKYTNMLMPFIIDIDRHTNLIKDTITQKEEEAINNVSKVYNELFNKIKAKNEVTINIYDNDLQNKLKEKKDFRKIEDENRLFTLELDLEKLFNINAFQPPFYKTKYPFLLGSRKQISESKFRLLNIEWIITIKVLNNQYIMAINKTETNSNASVEKTFIWKIWIYNFAIKIDYKKQFEYLTSFDSNFNISLFPYSKENDNALCIFEIEIRPQNYLDYVNTYNIIFEKRDNPPIKNCK